MISARRIALLLCVAYVVAAVAYGMTLELTSRWDAEDVVARMAIDYGLKALLSLPLVAVVFYLMRRSKEGPQIGLTLLMALPYAFAWQWLYYAVCDYFGFGHLDAAFGYWDVYIPLLVYGLQFSLLFAAQYHNRALTAATRAEELASAQRLSELAALKAQVNPHFLFNTLNAISASLPPEHEDTRELMSRLADLFRYQVIASKQESVPLHKELDFVRDYLVLAKARMGERLSYGIEVSPAVPPTAQVPPMLLQPLVENAVKHGLSPKLTGGRVVVSVDVEDGALAFEIRDDGVGFAEAEPAVATSKTEIGTGVGLGNTRRRLALGFDAALEVDSTPGAGTVVRFALPLPAAVVEAHQAANASPSLQTSPA